MTVDSRARHVVRLAILALVIAGAAPWTPLTAQGNLSSEARQVYDQVKAFTLNGGSAEVSALTLKRDRVEMTFTGTFYFGAATAGKPTGAVFIGNGTMRAEAPPSDFEKENIKRLLGADLVESDFKTAVLRFSDDTMSIIGAAKKDGGAAPAAAQKLADETDARLLQDTGTNIPARLAVSVLNGDTAGVFFAQFDGGRRGQFGYVFDPQGRIPVAGFNLNAGEKGVLFQFENALFFKQVWMAFYAQEDYAKNSVVYSDANDVVDATNYRLNIDVRDLRLNLGALIDLKVRVPKARAISFSIGEGLSASQKTRLERQMRVKRVRIGDGDISWVQEDWEGGFTVFLPKDVAPGENVQLNIDLTGNYLRLVRNPDCYYPLDNVQWMPRHGYFDRATFDLTFRHRKVDRIASVGQRVSEETDPEDASATMTRYRMVDPVALVTFAIGPFDRKGKDVTIEGTNKVIPIEFNSIQGISVKTDFFVGELDNALRYFSAMFGPFPYAKLGAALHPFGFGQGFATLLMIPPAQNTNQDVKDSDVFSFIAHEASHQWWGNIVAWRSYRDQWLSEGFAEYSGLLYAAKRGTDATKTTMEMLREMRASLLAVPQTPLGAGKGRLNDIGPIVQGLRLNTLKTLGAYQALNYSKGALVLRMLHFLLTNPANGNDAYFTTMMKDFVEQYRNGSARTEDFAAVASKHFSNTPIANKFGLSNLDWFFKQWVYGIGLPTYQMDYTVAPGADGALMLKGTVKQDNVGPDFQMVLPLIMSFEGNQEARTTVRANGPSTSFEIKLPAGAKLTKAELDPYLWVLSEKTTTKAGK